MTFSTTLVLGHGFGNSDYDSAKENGCHIKLHICELKRDGRFFSRHVPQYIL
jgi:hypothetical protein